MASPNTTRAGSVTDACAKMRDSVDLSLLQAVTGLRTTHARRPLFITQESMLGVVRRAALSLSDILPEFVEFEVKAVVVPFQ